MLLVFFFSSRRRHTRLVSDWSSDVCSSDLHVHGAPEPDIHVGRPRVKWVGGPLAARAGAGTDQWAQPDRTHADLGVEPRQELLEPLDRHLDVLHDLLALGPTLAAVDPVH